MADEPSSIERIKEKQKSLQRLKAANSLEERQNKFDAYIGDLPHDKCCEFMKSGSDIVQLCSNRLKCKYKGEMYSAFTEKPHPECKREKLIKFEDLLDA